MQAPSMSWATLPAFGPRGSAHSRNNLKQLQDQREWRRSATFSPRDPCPPGARAAAPLDAPLASAAYNPPGLLDRPDLLALVCGAWATGAGATSGAGIGHALVDGGAALSATLFTGGAFNLLCGLVDTGLSVQVWREARRQYRVFESLLGLQQLVLHELATRLRHGPEPALQAAHGLAQFNLDVLHGLLKAFEKAYLSPSQRPLAEQRRHLQLEHLVAAEEALRRRRQAIDYPDERRQGLAQDAERRRDALQQRIAEFDAGAALPPFERLREGLRHPIDALGELSDEQLAFLRDGVLQGAKLPFQLFTALTALLSQLIDSGAAGAALGIASDVAGPLAALLAGLGVLTAGGDWAGGQQRARKARASRRARLMAFENLAWQLHPAGTDPQADPLQRQQRQQVLRALARQLAKAVQRANRAKGVARARQIRGQASLGQLLLLGLPGLVAVLAGASLDAGIAALAAGGALGVWFLSQLARYQGYLAADRRRMRRRRREAEAVGEAGAGPAGNAYLSIAWLRGQLYEAGLQSTEAGHGEAPWCDAEHLLLGAGVPADTLRRLRQAVWVKTPAQHGQLVGAIATGCVGLRWFPPGASRRPAASGGPREPAPLLRTRAADAPGPFARLVDLEEAVKATGKGRLRRHRRAGRLARGLWLKPLATPRQASQRLERPERYPGRRAALQRELLGQLLNQLPRREDGLGIAWPERYRGDGENEPDTADCLLACLRELKDSCGLGLFALADDQDKDRWSDRWMRRRLRHFAELAEALEAAVQEERTQAEPWWDALVEGPPVFRRSDGEAERNEESAGPAPLPAYAIRV